MHSGIVSLQPPAFASGGTAASTLLERRAQPARIKQIQRNGNRSIESKTEKRRGRARSTFVSSLTLSDLDTVLAFKALVSVFGRAAVPSPRAGDDPS